MRILSTLFTLIVLIAVLSFALSNKQDVMVAVWPLPTPFHAPLYGVGLVPLTFGFLFGGLLGWASGLRHKIHAKKLTKELGALNTKIGELQKSATVQHAKVVPAKKPWWRI
jgi:uncharacterized integral membrane protein